MMIYLVVIEQVIGMVFSLELTLIFNNRWNVALITSIALLVFVALLIEEV
jgi:hypothetical protein